MKKIFLILTISLLLCFSSSARANEEEGQSSPSTWREKIEEKIQLRQENTAEHKEEVKAKLTERARNRIRNIYSRIKDHSENRIERLEKIRERIEERIPFFQEKGRDTSEALAKLAEAKTLIGTTRNDLESVDLVLEGLLEAEDPRLVFNELKDAVHTVRKDIAAARQALAAAVNTLVRNNPPEE